MNLGDIDYALPETAVAQRPVEPRDSARLLLDRGDAPPEDASVRDLVDELRDGDLLVVNDTKVLPARLQLSRESGGRVEVLLLDPIDPDDRVWTALARPGRKIRAGEVLFFEGAPALTVLGRTADGARFRIEIRDDQPRELIRRIGRLPLPPYIRETDVEDSRYQTVYARRERSAAAPTAGLHFTTELLGALEARGVGTVAVELVVGVDTFRPVTVDDPRRHPIHSESYRVDSAVLDACRGARRVVAVGTTATRALETAALTGVSSGKSELLITRGHDWRVVDLLLTNFHLPRTSLLLLVDAFVGERWRSLYETALARGYRFLSFGDAMLLDRHAGGRR